MKSRCNKLVALFVMMAASLFGPASLLAQSGAGSIQGTIQDATSSADTGRLCPCSQSKHGVINDTKSNSSGFYSVPGLFAGNYTVDFTAPGIEKVSDRGCASGRAGCCPESQAHCGDVAEQVTVSGDAVQLATYDSGTVSTQLDSNRIDQLPQNGRNVLGLAQNTVPGLESGGTRVNGLMEKAWNIHRTARP